MPAAIELRVYSGRPNPRVEIDASIEAELWRRLAELRPLDRAFESDAGLGYTGLHVTGAAGSAVREVEVSAGAGAGAVHVVQQDGRTRDLSDADRGFERWLLGVVRTRLTGDDQLLVEQIFRQLGDQGMANTHGQIPDVVGTWTKTTTAACADKYPLTMTFSTGTYRGTRGPGQGMVWWDAGIYRFEDGKTLVIGTATDELVSYQASLQGNQLEVTDAEGCRVTYRRT
jgi:hypothetical protein